MIHQPKVEMLEKIKKLKIKRERERERESNKKFIENKMRRKMSKNKKFINKCQIIEVMICNKITNV